ncbi:unnamed protein product [Rotaria sp. Silwood1]|nr:unnamed protein product [Rotaria sp. Silwood1]CAF1576805.1 unnamed protein product [Rotaria sp. Silwood1]CAF3718407.1 unnamed protein product [Rotaria sp. Silwood1]CAF3750229.1 unnamed protein product [Rotaria sp. Silwood1]CAF3757182.1 unnamed protein product [Rotaria sp. Silwood1]
METNETVSDILQQITPTVDNTTNTDMITHTDRHSILSNTNDINYDSQIIWSTSNLNEKTTLINISQINTDIARPWKIRALVSCEYPKRTFTNSNGIGEVSNWDLTDETGSITMVAFNLNCHMMSGKIKKNQAYEFTNLTIRTTSNAFKTLPHLFQLVCTSSTRVQEIDLTISPIQPVYNLIHLKEVNSIDLNSIVDVQVQVLRDYGVSTGTFNDCVWTRRDLHVVQDGIHIKLSLWNDQARLVTRNMAGLCLKLKNVKVSWFDGSRTLSTMANTQLLII